MFHSRMRVGVSVFAIMLMLFGTVVLPAQAAFVTTVEESVTDNLELSDNGHAYLYVESIWDAFTTNYLTHNDDIDVVNYDYESSGWSRSIGALPGPATRMYDFGTFNSKDWGWLGGDTLLPQFVDFYNSTNNELDLDIIRERISFPLTINQQSTAVLEAGVMSFGTFNLTSEEFVHMTVSSRQDSFDFIGLVIDPHGIFLMEFEVTEGNTETVPFRPTGPGMYTLIVMSMSDNAGLSVVDIYLESIVPEVIPLGGFVEGTLPGSELVVEGGTGAIVHSETAPTAHTYKFSSNTTYPGRIRYSMNYPELDSDIYEPYEPWMVICSDALDQMVIMAQYLEFPNLPGDTYHYMSFQEETYYLTVIGMENVEYSLFHDLPTAQNLPINQEFYLENLLADQQRVLFKLSLGEESVLKVNSSEMSGGYDWRLWRVFDDMIYRSRTISDATSLHGASTYYLPAGDYLVEAYTGSYSASGFYEFNLGPIIDGTGGMAVDNGRLIGFKFPTSALEWYTVNITQTTRDNVSVWADYDFYNMYGNFITGLDGALGNRQDGTSWLEYGAIGNSTEFTFIDVTNGFCIGVISPYTVQNNTAGLPGNDYHEYTVDYDVVVLDAKLPLVNGTDSITVNTEAVTHNFTLGDPGEPSEWYILRINAPSGTWMNVSVYVEDVSAWDARTYQVLDNGTYTTPWTSLGDTFTGSMPGEGAFQFGSVGDTIDIRFIVTRDLLDEGVLSITITPLTTNSYDFMPPLRFRGSTGAVVDILGQGGVVIIGGVAVVAIVVVVAVLVVKKRRG
ncbi:MAG: hypothetical protein ACXAEB_04710 [Candidatus Thorarchaeota archaeon]